MRAALGCALTVVALALAACGGDEPAGAGPIEGTRTLTVYSSLPMHGPSRRQSQDVVNAIKLALEQAGGKVGPLTITYVSLDSAVPDAGGWTSDQVLENARTAVRDMNTIAYIGELDSGATALSLPLLNEAGVLQISPSSTYVGLTRPGSGRKGEPERFYPSGRRTFGRLVPADDVQAAALVRYMLDARLRRVHILNDRELYGEGLADQVAAAAEEHGIEVVANEGISPRARSFADEADEVAASGADAFFYGGGTDTGAARVLDAVARADPRIVLLGGDAVAEAAFVERIDADTAERMRITSPSLVSALRPGAARDFRAAFVDRFGREPQPYAVYGYEAMRAALAAVAGAGDEGNRRAAVTEAFFALGPRRSALGTYSIDARGDTTLRRYGVYRIDGSELAFDRVLDVQSR